MSLISTATSGLMSSQVVLNMIGQNVANATTEGYSRLTAQLSSNSAGGVTVDSITRVVDQYLNTQLWSATSDVGYSTSYSENITSTESLLSSDTMGIDTLLDSFYSALSSASSTPDDDASREAVLSSAEALANGFNWLSENLNDQYSSINEQLDSSVTSVNDLTSTIATLNAQIVALKQQGGDTSSLEDSRDQAVTDLSDLIAVNVSEQSDGSYTLTLGQGQPLVSGSTAATLSLDNGEISLQYGSQTFSVNDDAGGSIGGLLDYETDVLTPTISALNDLAATIADEFNTLQASGYDADGNSGSALFTYDSSNAAGTLTVSSSITSDDLAFSDSATSGSNNNSNLLLMLDLQEDQSDTYSAMVSDVAIQSSSASATLTANTELVDSVTSSIASTSGVSSDEEAANLLTYQAAYEANAKVITVASELFDTLMSMF
nr:flagellar hook-associated protein FlgK [uncultured Tolumonas sp.]